MGSKQQTITVGCEAYSGRTKTEATQAALSHLATFMDGQGFTPVLVPVKGAIGVAFRDGNGFWSYAIRWDDVQASHTRPSTHGATWDRWTAEAKLRRHLAQHVYEPAEHNVDESMAVLLPDDGEGRADHERWLTFQECYTTLRGAGLGDSDAHLEALHAA